MVAGNLEAGEGRVADADSQVAVASQPSRSGINASQAAVEREDEIFRSLEESGLRNRRFQNSDGLVVDHDRHWNGCRSLPPWAIENRAGSANR